MIDKRVVWVVVVLCFLGNLIHVQNWIPRPFDPYYQLAQNMEDGKWMWICEDSYFLTGCRSETSRYPLYAILIVVFDVLFHTVYVTKLVDLLCFIGAVWFFYLAVKRNKLATYAYISITYIVALNSDTEAVYFFLLSLFFYSIWRGDNLSGYLCIAVTVFVRPSIALCMFVPMFVYTKVKDIRYALVPIACIALMALSGHTNPYSMFLSRDEQFKYYYNLEMPKDKTLMEKGVRYVYNVYEAFFVGIPKAVMFLCFIIPVLLLRNNVKAFSMLCYILALVFVHSLYFIEPRYLVTVIYGAYVLGELK